jgi:benzoyl-CoA-dihydrodiol lyase
MGETREADAGGSRVDHRTDPTRYRHWRVGYDGPVATLTIDVDEQATLGPGYTLKLNSYDLGVDIELNDAVQRIRFEHPEVRTVVMTSGKPRVFSAGANIYMLGLSSHASKVNFCKFTNETRNAIEDASRHSGLKFLAALNGTTAGGGYELALACDEIVLVDDRSSAVSLPEVALLGVLPGTGGLTRLTDKRNVRRDLADLFCTSPEGVRGQRARDWRLVDYVVRPRDFGEFVKQRALDLAALSDRPAPAASGVSLTPLRKSIDGHGLHYEWLDVLLTREAHTATFAIRAPSSPAVSTLDQALAAGASWWPLQLARELDDAILDLRANERGLGLWVFRTSGDPHAVLAVDRFLVDQQGHWFVREVIGMIRRTLQRLEVSSRSIFALVEPGSCFAGTLFELALAADRSYVLADAEATPPVRLALSEMSFGLLPTVNGVSRLSARFYGSEGELSTLRARCREMLSAAEAVSLGLVTAALDPLDWGDEVRQATESRVALSPDALTGLEANLRFGPPESLGSRVFGRLSAWQNWIFSRPGAAGEHGALKTYGSGARPRFDRERV